MGMICPACLRRGALAELAQRGEFLSYAAIRGRYGVALSTAKRDVQALRDAGLMPVSKSSRVQRKRAAEEIRA